MMELPNNQSTRRLLFDSIHEKYSIIVKKYKNLYILTPKS